MSVVICILFAPFVLWFALDYTKKYDSPADKRRRRRGRKWWK